MSSQQRRAKRKIATLVRMDQTRMRMHQDRRDAFAWSCMVPLGKRLSRLGLKERAIKALVAAGTDIPDGEQA